jgi:hypothetical protein
MSPESVVSLSAISFGVSDQGTDHRHKVPHEAEESSVISFAIPDTLRPLKEAVLRKRESGQSDPCQGCLLVQMAQSRTISICFCCPDGAFRYV